MRSNPASIQESGLSDRLIDVLEAERAKIAREIHDEAGQLLISAAFNIDQALAMLPQGVVARDLLQQAREALDECTQELHRLAFNLRPRMLDDLGLMPAVRDYLKRYAGFSGIELEVELGVPDKKLGHATELAIFRIIQEASANISKHSRATAVRVRLSFVGEYVELDISDNGIGFDPNAVVREHNGRPSLGLDGMLERAAALGGDLWIESRPSSGTTVRARLPVGD